MYVPSVCIVVQGTPSACCSKRDLQVRAEPVPRRLSRPALLVEVTEASKTRPYLCVQIHLDADSIEL